MISLIVTFANVTTGLSPFRAHELFSTATSAPSMTTNLEDIARKRGCRECRRLKLGCERHFMFAFPVFVFSHHRQEVALSELSKTRVSLFRNVLFASPSRCSLSMAVPGAQVRAILTLFTTYVNTWCSDICPEGRFLPCIPPAFH